ncbi:MAG: T9SS type A sorting domain-containing protein, partial [Bacteroidia bacterium]|nr:T9SS type A sorting domain-containing protein [Bacteroidia bacterium]
QNPAVVRFRFDPIFLPDSTTDLEGSNGFVKFGIQMMPGLPLGSTIENKAAIYFDFNAPIITNTVVHTLAEPTVCSSNTAIDLISSCEPILWIDGQLYDSSTSEARFTLQDASGCDSMVQLNFTLTEINAEVEQQGQTFTAFEEGAEYQWVDCDNNYESIQGARARSYTLPHSEGHVAVIISKNGCQDTSECFQVINLSSDNWKADEIRVFPNPANASVSVDLGTVYSFADLDLYDLMGKHVVKKSYANKRELKMDLAIARGIYLLKISTSNGKAVMTRLIKE